MNMDELTVCVTTYNEEENILNCIEGIKNNGVKHILIVDASRDRTSELAKQAGVKVITIDPDKRGRSVQKNIAIQYCNTKYLAFVDADDILDSNCLPILFSEMEQSGWDAIMAHGRAYSPVTYWEKAIDSFAHFVLAQPGPTNMIGRPCIHTIESLRAIGGCDARFKRDDDTVISIRLEEAGYKMGIGTGVTYRKHPKTFSENRKHWIEYGAADAQITVEYPQKKASIYYHLLINYPIKRSWILIKNGKIKYIPYTILVGVYRFAAMQMTLYRYRKDTSKNESG